MNRLTIRLDDGLALQARDHARRSGRSLNAWVVALLQAAVDPDLAGSEAERTRARLARAGLLVTPQRERPASRPAAEWLRVARSAAGTGTQLSKLVSDGRD